VWCCPAHVSPPHAFCPAQRLAATATQASACSRWPALQSGPCPLGAGVHSPHRSGMAALLMAGSQRSTGAFGWGGASLAIFGGFATTRQRRHPEPISRGACTKRGAAAVHSRPVNQPTSRRILLTSQHSAWLTSPCTLLVASMGWRGLGGRNCKRFRQGCMPDVAAQAPPQGGELGLVLAWPPALCSGAADSVS
jgi:hypothetical protein